MPKIQTEDYHQNPPVISITKATMDILLKQDKPDQLMALYLFYCYTSTWQDTRQIRATTNYTAQGMQWGVEKVKQVKKRLMGLGLIENIQARSEKDNHFGKTYIRVFYVPSHQNPAGTESVLAGEKPPKCLVTNKEKCLVTNTLAGMKPKSKTEITKFDWNASKKLHRIILTKKNINLNAKTWPNTFRLLRVQDKVPEDRIKKALMWYGHHIGDEYVPVAECARTFREKFVRIEAAMERGQQGQIDQPHKVCTHRMGADGKMGYYDDSMQL